MFTLVSKNNPAGDQPKAIGALSDGLLSGQGNQTLLGVTGSGKTFTIANVIAGQKKPVLVIAHNKTLAAQLTSEFKELFPENSVHYFVSYYDYYQPEAYIPSSDTYIEKEAMINDEIDKLRHAATTALLTRSDVIMVASVSCIYGLGAPEEYAKNILHIKKGSMIDRTKFVRKLVELHYTRTNSDLKRSSFRLRGNQWEIMPPDREVIYTLDVKDNTVRAIYKTNPAEGFMPGKTPECDYIIISPAKHFITTAPDRTLAIESIQKELLERLKYFESKGLLLEAERLERRTKADIAMLKEVGFCHGIENYSRHLSGRAAGDPPDTLLSYFQGDFLTVIDESHITVPQIRGMHAGDASRKRTLIEHGFRLPSAADNRPLTFDEFSERIGQVIYTSATPGIYEYEVSGQIVEQIIRPTGLVDPEVIVQPARGQIDNLRSWIDNRVAKHERVMVTTLTKKMAEDLTSYLEDRGVRINYIHSDVKTFDRIQILSDFRRGKYDVLVGVNLLREGLDLPEVSLVAILDADKEGFLRSETSLIQTIGRAARNVAGQVILYADTITSSLKRAIGETNRRRELQIAYNKKHGITPTTIKKAIKDITEDLNLKQKETDKILELDMLGDEGRPLADVIKDKEREMKKVAEDLNFELAAILRDEIKELKRIEKEGK